MQVSGDGAAIVSSLYHLLRTAYFDRLDPAPELTMHISVTPDKYITCNGAASRPIQILISSGSRTKCIPWHVHPWETWLR